MERKRKERDVNGEVGRRKEEEKEGGGERECVCVNIKAIY